MTKNKPTRPTSANPYSTDIPITDELDEQALKPLVVGWRAWIIRKLGGHVLTGEERALLLNFIWLPRLAKSARKTVEREAAEALENSFTTYYSKHDKK
jgi:hypothetical protein